MGAPELELTQRGTWNAHHHDTDRAHSSSVNGGNDSPRPSKRAKVAVACEQCKTKKVGCNGTQPCQRCVQDDRQCTFGRKEIRTPLTRQRMTELEDRIRIFENMWNQMFTEYPVEQALGDAISFGIERACDRARKLIQPKDNTWNVPEVEVRPSTHLGISRERIANHRESQISAIRDTSPLGQISLPPTRQASLDPEHHRYHFSSDGEEVAYEWQEHSGHLMDQSTIQADAGMGSLATSGRGASYLGLSSGATFLNAIKRLSPQAIPALSPNGPYIATRPMAMESYSETMQEWTSELPRSRVILPPAAEIKPLVDGYFQYFHHFTPLVHEPTIRAQISGAIPIVKPGSDVLMYMIFAMGALDSAVSEDDDDGYHYYLTARKSLDRQMLEGGTLPLVQGLAIMANYLQRSNRSNAGYLCLGMAIRMATALGLHTPVTSRRCSALEKEIRVRVWWSIVTLEAGCAVTFGRPHAHSPLQLAAVPFPLNCDDEHLTVSTTSAPESCDRPTLYTPLIDQAKLAKVACGIHDRILQSHPAPTVEQVKRYDQRILSALQVEPDFSRSYTDGPYAFARGAQIWRARDYRAILHRPILLAAAWDTSHRKALSPGVIEALDACRGLALTNLEEIGHFVSTQPDRHRGAEWYYLYFAFRASLTLLLSIVWEPHHSNATRWKAVLTSTVSWFRQIKSMRTLASAYASVLEGVVGISPSPRTMDQLIQAIGDTSSSNWSCMGNSTDPPEAEQINQDGLDFERYWMELWGNDTIPTSLAWPVADNPQNGWQI
ncbi:uncharacterized protein IL334_006349 [Kwoniella shivajii]|uniref:Zn(2)-C6 fungal-type domain-containing protein n=1 Tax=Kwoniella shivajii TaxID=564305 RepID=A0ABZ1D7L1_9TREE|nr:hypothetical protein IL334_006349 [Kwoniella shivajii]